MAQCSVTDLQYSSAAQDESILLVFQYISYRLYQDRLIHSRICTTYTTQITTSIHPTISDYKKRAATCTVESNYSYSSTVQFNLYHCPCNTAQEQVIDSSMFDPATLWTVWVNVQDTLLLLTLFFRRVIVHVSTENAKLTSRRFCQVTVFLDALLLYVETPNSKFRIDFPQSTVGWASKITSQSLSNPQNQILHVCPLQVKHNRCFAWLNVL